MGSPDDIQPPCLESNFFCVDGNVTGGAHLLDQRVFFNGPKLMLYVVIVVGVCAAKMIITKIMPLDPMATTIDKRFQRITNAILTSAENAVESNDRPMRPQGSFDYSFAAAYLNIDNENTMRRNRQSRVRVVSEAKTSDVLISESGGEDGITLKKMGSAHL